MNGQSPLGFIKHLTLAGFGAMAWGLWLNQKALKKFGYEMHPVKTDGGNITNCLNTYLEAPTLENFNSLNNAEKAVIKTMHKGLDDNVLLVNLGEREPTLEYLKERHLKSPAIIKATIDGETKLFAYVNASTEGKDKDNADTGLKLVNIENWRKNEAYKDLKFPSPSRKRSREGKLLDSTGIKAPKVMADVKENYKHIQVPDKYAHKDTHLDNRMLVVKEKEKDAEGEEKETYFTLMQCKDGSWCKQELNGELLEGNHEVVISAIKEAEENENGSALGSDVIDQLVSNIDRKAKVGIKTKSPTFTPEKLQAAMTDNSNRLKVSIGAGIAPFIAAFFKQAVGNAQYAGLNAFGSKVSKNGLYNTVEKTTKGAKELNDIITGKKSGIPGTASM